MFTIISHLHVTMFEYDCTFVYINFYTIKYKYHGLTKYCEQITHFMLLVYHLIAPYMFDIECNVFTMTYRWLVDMNFQTAVTTKLVL